MGGDARFPTTLWDDIRSVQGGAPGPLESLLGRYRAPVIGFLRWKGCGEHEAEDLAQEVLLRLSRPDFIARVDASKGRFRALVAAVTRHVLSEGRRKDHAERRGGGARVLRESELDPEALVLSGQAAAPDDSMFDRLWVTELVSRSMKELEAALPPATVAAFRHKYLEGLTQEETAARLGTTVFNVKNWVLAGRAKFKERLLAAVKAYCATPDEFDAELRRLAPYWQGPGA
jgi:RNA polymerase sigma-70 factor (ECF subfamily)